MADPKPGLFSRIFGGDAKPHEPTPGPPEATAPPSASAPNKTRDVMSLSKPAPDFGPEQSEKFPAP